jgi:hypothetical protein
VGLFFCDGGIMASMKAKQLLFIMVPIAALALVLALVFWFMRDQPDTSSDPNQNDTTGLVRPEVIKVSGEIICLTPKDTSGPQTQECALGLRDEQGKNYSLSTTASDQISSLPVGSKVTVMAVPKPPAAKTKYDVTGSLQVQSVVNQ